MKHMAFEDADLVTQHQQLGPISGAVVEGCKGEVDEEAEAGVEDEEEHGRRLIVAGLAGPLLSSDGLLAPHRGGPECTYRGLQSSAVGRSAWVGNARAPRTPSTSK